MNRLRTLALVSSMLLACGAPAPVGWTPPPMGMIPETLSGWNFFTGADMAAQNPSDGVVPYEVNAPLFSDYAAKHRFLAVPAGTKITYSDDGKWQLPVGGVAVKTFAFPRDERDPSRGERLLETRVLVRTDTGYTGTTYVWNEAQTEATRVNVGADIPGVQWIDAQGASHTLEYKVPNRDQCKWCHGLRDTDLLGVRTRQLNRAHDYGRGAENQVDHLASMGLLEGAPLPAAQRAKLADYAHDATLDPNTRARSYLEANCGHCHRNDARNAYGYPTGLFLALDDNPNWVQLGVCKNPVMAGSGATGGFSYNIDPGHPERSIMVFRMLSEDPTVKMPVMPTRLHDPLGVQIVSDWIQILPTLGPQPCP